MSELKQLRKEIDNISEQIQKLSLKLEVEEAKANKDWPGDDDHYWTVDKCYSTISLKWCSDSLDQLCTN